MKRRKGSSPTGLGKRIEKIVDEKKLLKKDFAASLGVSPNYIYQIAAVKRATISASLAKLIETLYGYPSGWVLNGSIDADARDEAIRKLKSMDADKMRRAAEFIDELENSPEIERDDNR